MYLAPSQTHDFLMPTKNVYLKCKDWLTMYCGLKESKKYNYTMITSDELSSCLAAYVLWSYVISTDYSARVVSTSTCTCTCTCIGGPIYPTVRLYYLPILCRNIVHIYSEKAAAVCLLVVDLLHPNHDNNLIIVYKSFNKVSWSNFMSLGYEPVW